MPECKLSLQQGEAILKSDFKFYTRGSISGTRFLVLHHIVPKIGEMNYNTVVIYYGI